MSWKLRATPPLQTRGFDIQTNAPAYQNALLQDMDRFLSPTDNKPMQEDFDLPDFATPSKTNHKKVKSASHHHHSDKSSSRQENVPPQSSADKSCEMATPRGSLARPKVTPKDKATETVHVASPVNAAKVVKPPDVSSLLECAGIHSGRPHSEHIPTAHVFPSPSTRNSTTPATSHAIASTSRFADQELLYTTPAASHATASSRFTDQELFYPSWTTPHHGLLLAQSDRFLNPLYPSGVDLSQAYNSDAGYGSGSLATYNGTHRQQAPPVDASTFVSHASVLSSDNRVNQFGSGYPRDAYRQAQTGGLDRHAYTHIEPSATYMPDTYAAGCYARTTALSGVAGSAVASPDGFVSDLNRWPQQHQQQLRRQQLDVCQSLYSDPGLPSTANITGQSASLGLLSDQHRLDMVKAVADDIIKEKDNIIEQQKMKIAQLDRQSRNGLVHKVSAMNISEDTNGFITNHQEAPGGSARRLHALSSRQTDDLQKKLGQCEYEIDELKANINRDTADHQTRLALLEDKLRVSEKEVTEWKGKHLAVEECRDTLQKKLDGLERYLGDLPTSAEHGKRSVELKSLKEERSRYKTRVGEVERKMAELTRGLTSRDSLIQSLEDSHRKLNVQLKEKEKEASKIRKDTDVYRRDSRLPSFLFDDETQDLQQELAVVRGDYDKAKKLVEGLQRRLQVGDTKHLTMTRQLEEKLQHEQASVTALREELSSKDGHLKKLNNGIKQMGAENEDLLEKQIAMVEYVQELEQQMTADIRQLEQRLLADLSATFCELQALVHVCMKWADGHDPNISVLLGVKTSSAGSSETQSTDTCDKAQSLKYKLSRVHELRKEIDRLRELFCNKYAEEMSDNLNCTTQ